MGIEGSPIIGSDVFGLFCQRLSQHIIGKERDSLSLELEQKQRPQTTETHTYSRPCLLINFAESNFPCRGRKNKKKKKGSPIYPGSFCVAADSFFFRETPKCKCISSFFLIQLLFAISENVMGQVCFQLLLVYTTFAAFVLTLKAKELTSFFLCVTRYEVNIRFFVSANFFLRYPKQK